MAGSGMLSVDKVERRHKRASTSFGSGLVGREVLVVHTLTTHVHRVVVTTSLHSTIQGIVLDTGHHLGVALHLSSLVATHIGLSHRSPEEGILAITLSHTAPTGIKRDVDHGRVDPVDAVGGSLGGSDACSLLDSLNVPRT